MSKKIVFFIDKSNGFPNALLGYMEENFPKHYRTFYSIDRRNEVVMEEGIIKIKSYKEFLLNRRIKKDIEDADLIVLSGIFTLQYIFSTIYRKYLYKTILQFWGGDYIQFRMLKKKKIIKKIFYSICIKKAKSIVTMISSEKNEFLSIFPIARNKQFFYAPVSGKSDLNSKLLRKEAMEKFEQNKSIVIGNSATRSNQHAEIFEMFRGKDLKGIKVICPLSYGETYYREEVIALGKEIFNEAFVPITDYMSRIEYQRVLMECKVGIYNTNRQQGLGNISILTNLGKKIYIRKDNPMWSYYESLGYRFFDCEDIKNMTVEEILTWTKNEADINFEAIESRKEDILANWKMILS